MVLRGFRKLIHKRRHKNTSESIPTISSQASGLSSLVDTSRNSDCVLETSHTVFNGSRDLWQEAFKKLDQATQEKLRSIRNAEDSIRPTAEELLQTVIQDTQRQYDEERKRVEESKSRQLRTLAHKILSAALSFQSVIGAVAACDPTGHAATAWTLVSLALTMSKNRHDLRGAAFESSGFLADTLTRYAMVEMDWRKSEGTNAQTHLENALIDTYCAILKYTAETVAIRQASVGKMTFLSVNALNTQPLSTLKSAIGEQDQRLQNWMRVIESRRQHEEAEELLKKIDAITGDIRSLIQDFEVSKLTIAEGAAYDSHANEHNEECLKDTRTDLLKQIMMWADSPKEKCIFWLSGMAGTGKSTISKTIARELREKNHLGASFFFKRGEADRGNVSRFFATIVRQLIVQEPRLIPSVKQAIENDFSIATKRLPQQFEALILKPLLALNNNYSRDSVLILVIDALDECDNNDDVRLLIDLLPRVQESRAIQVRIFITSRPEFIIKVGFEEMSQDDHDNVALHEIPVETVKQDISLFVRHRLSQIVQRRPSPIDLSGWPEESDLSQLIQIATPLFISAATMCRFIENHKKDPRERLKMILKSQPADAKSASHISTLRHTYLPIFDSILEGEDRNEHAQLVSDFKALIGPLVLLADPLPISALACLLDISESETSIRLSFLSSVISVPKNSSDSVRPFHLSFRDFLLAAENRNMNPPFWIDRVATHAQVALDCIRVMQRPKTGLHMNLCNLPSYGTLRSEIDREKCNQDIPAELRYACRYWIHHLEQGKAALKDGDETHQFLEKHFLHWFEAMALLGYVSEVLININILRISTEAHTGSMLANFLYDAWRFILKNLSIADEAPLQLYSSSLVFAPQNSVIKKKFAEYLPRCISHLPLVKVEWGADLQSLGDSVHGVNGLACSPDGGLIASIMKFGEINLWSTVTGTLRQSWKTGIGESTLIYGLAFSPDGKLLALGSSKGTSLWNMSSGTLSKALPNRLWSPSRPAFSPDGTALLLQDKSTQPSTLGLWDIAQSRFMQNLEGHIDGLKSLVISHNGQIVATGSDNGILRLWTLNVNRTVPTQIQAHSQPVESLAFSPDDDLIVTGSSDCENYVWTVKDSTRLHRLVDKENGYRADTSVEFSCDGRLVASGFGDGIINMWNSTSGELERSFSHPSPVKTMALSHTGELISGSSDGVVRIWDTCIEDQVSRVRHPDFSTAKVRVVMSPDGSLALAIRYSHGATVVDIATGSTMWLTGSDWIFSFDTIFSINNQLIAVALIMNVMIWDRASGKLIQDLRISNNKPVRYRIAFRPDNKLIIWVPGNGQLQVWDPISGKQLETLGTYDDMGFLTVSYDGQLLACTNGSTISIWDLSTKSSFNLENKNRCEAVAISPDNMTLVVLSGTRALGLWNLRSRRLYNYLSLLTWSETIHFSEDGKYITADKQSYHAESDGEGQVVSISLIDDQLRMENQWVYLGNERFLWIPEEYGQSKIYGGMTAHRRDQTLCLDSSHGNISCISFDRNARWDPL